MTKRNAATFFAICVAHCNDLSPQIIVGTSFVVVATLRIPAFAMQRTVA